MVDRRSERELVQIHNFVYRYPAFQEGQPPVTALDGISLEIAAGEFFGLTGTTGSGKSTLCLALNGLVPQATGGVVSGDIIVAGMNTKRAPVAELAMQVGLVFQDPEANLVGLTVEDEVAFGPENLGLPRDEIAARVDWALDVVGMGEMRRRSSTRLSGGQKQRVAIAAVLAMRPAVLVLDEPTAQLDPAGTEEVASAIAALRREPGHQVAIVMAEQNVELLGRFADRIGVLDAGRLARLGTPREVLGDVDKLHRLGVFTPPAAEIARRLNALMGTNLDFVTTDGALLALTAMLDERRDG